MKNKSSIYALCSALAFFLAGCGKSSPDKPDEPEVKPVSVTSVSVSPTSLDLTEGGTATLTASVLPANATDPSVSWSSSNTGVATVGSGGDVKAVAPGKATITVTTTDGGKKAECVVTVSPAHVAVQSVTITPDALSLEKRQTATLAVKELPENASNPSVVWSSSDESVATVSQEGVISALETGTVVITASSADDGTKKAECKVEVVESTHVIRYKSYQNVLVTPSAYGGLGAPVSNTFNGEWGELVFEKSIQYLGNDVFKGCSDLLEVVLPSSVGSVGDNAFSGCTSLSAIRLPEGLESLGESAFYNCTALEKIALPKSLKSVGSGAFSRCSRLESFESDKVSADGRCLILDGILSAFAPAGLATYSIPSGIKQIAPSVLKYCTKITEFTVPASVTSVGGYAFYNCTSLQSVTFAGTTPPELGENAFLGTSGSLKIYVPASALTAYRQAPGWLAYVERIVGIE